MGDENGTNGDGQKRRLSPETREKLSRLAKERHAAGKFGGAEFGRLGGRGRTREKRLAQEALAEHLQEPEVQDLMKAALMDALRDDSIAVRLKALQMGVDIESGNIKREQAAQQIEDVQRSRDELLNILSEKLSSGPAAGMLGRAIQAKLESANGQPVIEAQVIEEDDGDGG